jgi:hypothetical protein
MGAAPIIPTALIPVIRNKRPRVIQSTAPNVLSAADLDAWMLSQGSRYRSTSIPIDAATQISHCLSEPIIAGRGLIDGDAGMVAGQNSPSPTSLIKDRWHDLVITATETKTFSVATPQSTLAVEAIDRVIPAGFVISFDGGSLTVMVSAAVGAVSLTLRRIHFDVTVNSNDEAIAANGYFYQQGEGSPLLSTMALVGHPDPHISPGSESARKYSCDGVAVSAMGGIYQNLELFNFPGHGLWVSSPTNFSTLAQLQLPWDKIELYLDNIWVGHCLSGITVAATDAQFSTLVAAGCRDYGIRFLGYAGQGSQMHCYGCGVGVSIPNGIYANIIQAETNNYGGEVFGYSQIGSWRGFGNTYRGLLVDSLSVNIGSLLLSHSSGATSADPYPTGWAAVVRGFSDRFMCSQVGIDADSGAKGLMLGQDGYAHDLFEMQLKGRITGYNSPGPDGLRIGQTVVGSDLNLNVNGFANCLWISNGVSLAGNTIRIRGTSTNTVRWADGTTGTYAAPNIPAAVSSANEISFHVY